MSDLQVLQRSCGRRGKLGCIVFAVAASAMASYAVAQEAQHHHGKRAPPAAFVASTAKPFSALMNDAMDVMDDGMRHEGFFTADGKEVWVVVRGENYVSIIDPNTFKETGRIEAAPGSGMVLFHPDGKLAFVVSSFTPEVDVIDVASRKVVKRIPVVSPFSPFLQFTPDYKEI